MAKATTYQDALPKIEQYCAYQERCHQEVRFRLLKMGLRGDDLENLIVHLVENGFLDETRFAKAYARGKLRNNGWGWHRISMELKRKQISDYNLQQAKSELDPEEYQTILREMLNKKNLTLNEKQISVRREKLFRFAYGRGFEADVIHETISGII